MKTKTLVVATVLAGSLAGTGSASATAGPSGDFDVTGYDITMDYRPDSRNLQGVTVVSAVSAESLRSLTLALDGPRVRSVEIDSQAARYTQSGEDLVVEPATPIGRGARFTVRISYDGTPGAAWLPTTSGGATAFEGGSSAWFPAHEDGHDKARFHLVATVPDGWGVVSIGREGAVRHEPGATTYDWTEPAADPDFIAVSVDRFTIDRSALADGTPVVNAYAPGLEAATRPLADRLPEILGFLSGRFGPYPFDAAGNVFVDVNDDGPGTSPQTRPVYLGAGNSQYMNIQQVVHEQAHQWYGVSVAPGQAEDGCLAECFASYATWLWDEAEGGADLDARYREQVEAAKGDSAFWQPLYRPGQLPGLNMYSKGPLALHALRRQIGDEAFGRLLKGWAQAHRGEYVGWPEFEAFAGRISGQDLTGFFQAWFRGATVPADGYL
ncbi:MULTISPECIES: M1 family metallopeptidase [Amycolatopsis]|nr:M1 family metallopeptidase [Amycolatopsis sacchari]